MTREEAITILNMVEAHGSLVVQAKDMAIKALSAEPCDDCISRKWLKNAIHNFYKGLIHTPTEEDIQAYIYVAPSVKPQYTEAEIQRMQELEQAQLEKAYEIGKAEQPKTGHWIKQKFQDGEYPVCSECGMVEESSVPVDMIHYCFNCGAKMESEEKE